MKMGVHREALGPSLTKADEVWLYAPPDLGWDVSDVMTSVGKRGHLSRELDAMAEDIARSAKHGDHLLVMSNGGFGGLHGKLLAALNRAA